MENIFSQRKVGAEGPQTILASNQVPSASYSAQDAYMGNSHEVEEDSGSEGKSEEDFDPDDDEEVEEEVDFENEDSFSDDDSKKKKGKLLFSVI